jgi:hypothetical protein
MAYKDKQKGTTQGRAFPRTHGLLSRVAKAEGVSRQFVQQVASGLRKSKRIESALGREMRKLQRLLAKEAA